MAVWQDRHGHRDGQAAFIRRRQPSPQITQDNVAGPKENSVDASRDLRSRRGIVFGTVDFMRPQGEGLPN